MRQTLLISTAATAALMLYACGGAKEEAKKDEAPAAATAPPVDEASAATVSGKVAFTGDKPVAKPISMDATPACARQHSTPPKSEEVVLNANGTLRNVFVWVKGGLPDRQWPTPATPVSLDQKQCIYNPHVIGVMVNQNVEITNSDPTNHNIHPLPKINREWNESQPPQGEKKIKQFPREEVLIPVKCNVHPWMRSYIGVVSHPFFAVTSDEGTFTIKGLPPGDYTVEAWHEKYGTQEQKIKVEAKQSATLDFTFKG
jgi:plastocyanin